MFVLIGGDIGVDLFLFEGLDVDLAEVSRIRGECPGFLSAGIGFDLLHDWGDLSLGSWVTLTATMIWALSSTAIWQL